MIRTRSAGAALFLALSLGLAAPPCFAGTKLKPHDTGLTGAAESIPRNAVTAGGQLLAAANLNLDAATGEAQVSRFSGSGMNLYPGLMNIMAQPGSVVAITTVTKTSGTLDLAWSAPGIDGFQGHVANGQYRIDYSSDALHVFDPSVFQVSFPTTVAPGDPQAYFLTGLLANTTYYARIYLADITPNAPHVVAETSAQSNQSTLADLPGTPKLVGVFITSVTFSWVLPPLGAEGYQTDTSTTNYGALLPGGVVITSMTPNGLQVSFTARGLAPSTTYYFKLASLNWQSEPNFTSVFSTCTLPPPPVYLVSVSSDAYVPRQITLNWTVPSFPGQDGVVVQLSTNPITTVPVNGIGYSNGEILSDGSVVVSSAAQSASYLATSFGGSPLALDTTYFFSMTNQYQGYGQLYIYSMAVTTSAVLDLPPMMPSGLALSNVAGAATGDTGLRARQTSAQISSVTLTWNAVSSKLDGTPFKVPGKPTPWEMQFYKVDRATGIVNPAWVSVATLPVTSTSLLTTLPDPTQVYYYRVAAVDGFQPLTDASMVADTSGNVYALDQDNITRIDIPRALMDAASKTAGAPLIIRVADNPGDLGFGGALRSVTFTTYQSPSNIPTSHTLSLPGAAAQVVLGYSTEDGNVVPSVAGRPLPAAAASPGAVMAMVPVAKASQDLAMYWNNGQNNYVNLYGQVDSLSQTVQVNSADAGKYQIRAAARTEAGSDFILINNFNKAITPNNPHGLNSQAHLDFTCLQGQGTAVSGKIFDVRGLTVSDMQVVWGPNSNTSGYLLWDGKSNGRVVPGGIYIYQVQAEGKVWTGTFVVIR
jgi:hypothetical protein